MSDSQYFPVKINSIYPSIPTSFDLYIQLQKKHVLYLHAGDELDEEKIKKLDKFNHFFYVLESERQAYKEYVHEILSSDKLAPKEKAEVLRESSYSLVCELYENPNVHQALDNAKDVVFNFVDFMDAEPEGMEHLISLSTHDFYTYNHSLDVGIYSLGLGQAAQFSRKELTELGQGALFHDIGKRHVATEIICKAGPLDAVEWAQMQKHPLFGLKILCEHEGVSEAIKACCFEHHENFLGTGYPQQLTADEIHPMARIIALTDTYDALTTKRSYNQPMTPKEALDFMKNKLADRYDPELLSIFHSTLFKMDI